MHLGTAVDCSHSTVMPLLVYSLHAHSQMVQKRHGIVSVCVSTQAAVGSGSHVPAPPTC